MEEKTTGNGKKWKYPKLYAPPPPSPAKKDPTSFKEMQTRPCLQVLSGGPLGGQLSAIYRKFALCFQLTFGVTLYVPTQTVIL